jgi:hypothetical protein
MKAYPFDFVMYSHINRQRKIVVNNSRGQRLLFPVTGYLNNQDLQNKRFTIRLRYGQSEGVITFTYLSLFLYGKIY